MARPPAFGLDELTSAGLAVVEAEGWPAVTFRSVAGQLGVSPMALYRLVANAHDLRCAIADAVAQPFTPDLDAGDLYDALDRWARSTYRRLARYSGLASFLIAEWTELPAWLDIIESLLEYAERHGVTGERAVAHVNAVYAYVLARAQLLERLATAPQRRLAHAQADPKRYRLIRANLAEFRIPKTDKHFAIGLDALIMGLRSESQPRRLQSSSIHA